MTTLQKPGTVLPRLQHSIKSTKPTIDLWDIAQDNIKREITYLIKLDSMMMSK